MTKEGATIALTEIKKLPRSRGLVPVINKPQQFSQLETSCMLTDNGINLVIHLPLASDETTLSIYNRIKYNITINDNYQFFWLCQWVAK